MLDTFSFYTCVIYATLVCLIFTVTKLAGLGYKKERRVGFRALEPAKEIDALRVNHFWLRHKQKAKVDKCECIRTV